MSPELPSFGDRDGDGDVDATDKGTVGVTWTGTVSGLDPAQPRDPDGSSDNQLRSVASRHLLGFNAGRPE